MPERRRVGPVSMFLAICVLFSGIATYAVIREKGRDTPDVTGTTSAPPSSDVLFFIDDSRDPAAVGHVGWTSTDQPGASRTISTLTCERFHFRASRGLCLARNSSNTGIEVKITDASLKPVWQQPMDGAPSRTRISDDGRFGASTVFVFGHSYESGGFVTRTAIYDMRNPREIATLEDFTTTIDGKKVTAADINYWGVTFLPADSNQFFATLSTGGKTHLVKGDIAARTAVVMHDNVECPSVSPDGKRVAYKKRTGSSNTIWRFHVLDLATMSETPLAETASVDDQLEWLDNDHVAYSTITYQLRSIRADGSGSSAVVLNDAESPSAVR